MRFEKRFTKDGQAAYASLNLDTRQVRFVTRMAIVFRAENIGASAVLASVLTDILAQKYFRKAGVPAALKSVEENGAILVMARSGHKSTGKTAGRPALQRRNICQAGV